MKLPIYSQTVLTDSYGRKIRDLRISVTDRCNFRCIYCMPAQGVIWKRREEILSYEEILFLTEIFVSLGITRVRVTGGEPLLRRGIVGFIKRLSAIGGLEDIAMTTNGYFLADFAEALVAAGLRRVSISMDSVAPEIFASMTKVSALDRVLDGIRAAQASGLAPIKINMVVIRGVNDAEIVALAEFARTHGLIARYIEYMPLDGPSQWSREKVVSGKEIYERVNAVFPLEPLQRHRISDTAKRYRFVDGEGEIGIIAPVTEPFCGACSRIRLTADGKLRTCLFSLVEHDLRGLLRSGASRKHIERAIVEAVLNKEPGHRINEPDYVYPERTMSCIGG
ncbi:MAG: GTP 3',8-cyclase MoaA [Acidobacteriota bacterium]|nr:GTP 3',8-cyclase MoaA [Blastocatellia bacterium]MDW8412669.1 GTP 3',8-cyclase MoaA [Acidobacteriota bacterium]